MQITYGVDYLILQMLANFLTWITETVDREMVIYQLNKFLECEHILVSQIDEKRNNPSGHCCQFFVIPVEVCHVPKM